MSTEENKALVHRYYEAWNEALNKQNLAGVDELFAPDFVIHGTGLFPDMDLAGVKQVFTAWWTVFPDWHYTLEDLIAEGDKVAHRYTVRGTHQGEIMGIPPTGKRVSATGIEIDRIKDGKIVESWFSSDMLGLMQQLGAIPQMAQGRA
jgi:steroid delta-isomerase-like uncharacterized protein